MRVVHRPVDGDEDSAAPGYSDADRDGAETASAEERVLATDVEFADGILSQGLGLMFRRSVPDDYALVFRFAGQRRRGLHMLCVPFDVDAVWLCDGVVQRVARLSAWTGLGGAVADTVVELPAGAAEGVEQGDRVVVEGAE